MAESHENDFGARFCLTDGHTIGHDSAIFEAVADVERVENARCVGGQLDAGADIAEPVRLFGNDDPVALANKRQRCRQSTNPGTRNEDGS